MDGSRQKELQILTTMDRAQQKELAIDVEKEATKPPESPGSEPLPTTGYRRYFSVEVTNAHADVLLLTCCFVSGLVDSTVYNAFGTFVSMQTVSPPSLALCLQFSRNAPNYEPILTAVMTGQHHFPWPWGLHFPLHIQALRMGQISSLHHVLLSRLFLLQPDISSPFAPSPLDSHHVFLSPVSYHLPRSRIDRRALHRGRPE